MSTQPNVWGEKPYYSLNAYCDHVYHQKLYKIAIDAGFTCPNRDGTLDDRGCIFCSAGGSGDFAVKISEEADQIKSIDAQIKEGLSLFGEKKVGTKYIAYFQAYTNTYAPVERLRCLYTQALLHKEIAGISIATRPDCLSEECLAMLKELYRQYPGKFIWIELGLQTIHEKTAEFIRRGYPLSVFEGAMKRLQACNIPVIVHVILGLPGENAAMQYETIDYLNQWKPFGIKLQLLHILKGTDLAEYYKNKENGFETLTLEEYMELLIGCVERLSPDIVLHRLTGDGPKELLIAPVWSLNKRNVLNTLHKQMGLRETYQGRLYRE